MQAYIAHATGNEPIWFVVLVVGNLLLSALAAIVVPLLIRRKHKKK